MLPIWTAQISTEEAHGLRVTLNWEFFREWTHSNCCELVRILNAISGSYHLDNSVTRPTGTLDIFLYLPVDLRRGGRELSDKKLS